MIMQVMTTESRHALFLGFSSKLVSQLKKHFLPHIQLGSLLSNALAHWRQTYFRPNKPLPTNVGSNQSCLPMAPRQPFKWVIIDFVISCLFLLCIFFGRTCLSTRIIDGESGCGIFVLGACTCFVVRPYTSFTWQTVPSLSLPLY